VFSLPLWSYQTYEALSPQIREARRLYALGGRAFPLTAFPLTAETLGEIAGELVRDPRLNPDLRLAAAALLESLPLPRAQGEVLTGADLGADLEGALAGDFVVEPVRWFYDRFVAYPDFFKLKTYVQKKDLPGLQFSLGLKRIYRTGEIPPHNLFYTPNDWMSLENFMIRSGFFAWQNQGFEIRLGRSPVHYGDPRWTGFLPSWRLPYLDALEYRYRWGNWEMVSSVSVLDNRMGEEERDFFTSGGSLASYGSPDRIYLGSNRKGGDSWFYLAPPSSDPSAPPLGAENKLSLGFGQTIILNALHRFTWRNRFLSLGITGNMVAARENNALHLADIFPVFSWHNAEVGGHNFSLVAEALWTILPGLDLYLQAAYDDISATDLLGIADTAIPTIDAYLLGLGWETGLAGRPLSVRLEAGVTHYLWGSFHAYDEAKGNYLGRAIYRYRAQKETRIMPLTSPYGPGARWLELNLALGSGSSGLNLRRDPLGPLALELNLSYLDHLEGVDLIRLDYPGPASLKNAPRLGSFSSGLTLVYTLPGGGPNSAAFYGAAGLNAVEGRWWPEFRLGARWRGTFLRREV
jgi:hypothetical protein